jgi:hypothetical protein
VAFFVRRFICSCLFSSLLKASCHRPETSSVVGVDAEAAVLRANVLDLDDLALGLSGFDPSSKGAAMDRPKPLRQAPAWPGWIAPHRPAKAGVDGPESSWRVQFEMKLRRDSPEPLTSLLSRTVCWLLHCPGAGRHYTRGVGPARQDRPASKGFGLPPAQRCPAPSGNTM